MFRRILSPLKSNSFFLFGARGTGKTTFLRNFFSKKLEKFWFDLLDAKTEDILLRNPNSLIEQIEAKKENIKWVIIDEIQKIPKLLDLVHKVIESSNIKFALTGSSARKLKKGSANLLAGRAFVNHLFPLTHLEMKESFNLNDALNWGTLPKITELKLKEEKEEFLRAYAHTYLKEEIWAEHLIRNLNPFRKFLEIAAQTNSEIVNYTNVSLDVGVDVKTIQSYYEILEDTLIGFFLDPYHESIRKQQRKSPKFYLFDSGVTKALARTLTQKTIPNTYGFGKSFEHFIIAEIYRLNIYNKKDFKLSYLLTKDQAEIDLIVERPGNKTVLIEIKSSEHVDNRDTKTLEHFKNEFNKSECFVLSRDPYVKKIGNVYTFPWQEGIKELGLY